jgi:hypothetical protein
MNSLRFGRCDIAIAWKSVDQGSSGKKLPHAAALVAMRCRRGGEFAACLFADLVEIPHRFALPCFRPLPGATDPLPSLSFKAGSVPTTPWTGEIMSTMAISASNHTNLAREPRVARALCK